MKAAQILNNVVTNVIEINVAEDAGIFNAVVCPDNTSIGWGYVDETFNEPPLPDITTEEAHAAINAIRTRRQSGVMPITISSGTFNYPYGELEAMKHFNTWQAITAGMSTVPSYWRDEDNNDNAVIADDFLAMAGAINTFIFGLVAESHAAKARIGLLSDDTSIRAEIESFEAYQP